MEIRAPEEDDLDEIGEVVHDAMRASYALSPQQIDQIVEEEFGEEPLSEKLADEETLLRVVETGEETEDKEVSGIVEATVGDVGEVNWLFVDTAQRGKGVGTELFETASEELRDAGADSLRMALLEDNTEGQQFVERFGFEHVGERELAVGDQAYVEYEYAGPDADVEADTTPKENEEVGDDELPETEREDGHLVATDEDGTTVYLDTDADHSGTTGRFLEAFTDPEFEEQFGFYCSNCGSLDASMDNMERIECGNCANRSVSRSSEEYDDTYL